MKRKVLFVHETFGRLAGAEQNILVTAPRLAEEFDLEFLYGRRSGRDEASFERIFPVHHAADFDGPAAPVRDRVSAVLRASAPDFVYVHKCVSVPVLEALEAWGGPRVRMEHDHDIYCMRSYKYFPWSRRICTRRAGPGCLFPCLAFLRRDRARGPLGVRGVSYRRQMRGIALNRGFAAFFVVTAYMRDELVRQGFAAERIHIFPPIPEPPRETFTSTFSDRNRIVFAGQIIRGKGLDVLLQALALCRQPFVLTVLGSGSHQAYCERLAGRLGLGGRVEFPGFIPFEQLVSYYREATLVAVPSVWPEPIATIGLEAMRYGLPVVGFDAGGIRDWLRDGETGYLIPWMDRRAMAEKIDRLLGDKDAARAMGARAREFVDRAYAFEPYIARMKAQFHALMRPAAPAGGSPP